LVKHGLQGIGADWMVAEWEKIAAEYKYDEMRTIIEKKGKISSGRKELVRNKDSNPELVKRIRIE
jgi:hypothetical protein